MYSFDRQKNGGGSRIWTFAEDSCGTKKLKSRITGCWKKWFGCSASSSRKKNRQLSPASKSSSKEFPCQLPININTTEQTNKHPFFCKLWLFSTIVSLFVCLLCREENEKCIFAFTDDMSPSSRPFLFLLVDRVHFSQSRTFSDSLVLESYCSKSWGYMLVTVGIQSLKNLC